MRCKVAVVGDAHVGKTALTQMFYSGGQTYQKNYAMTIGVDFCVKVVNIPETNVAVELYLFDTSGQPIFNQRELGAKNWSNASQMVVVYDVSSRDSFKSCAKWVMGVRATRPGKPIPGVLVANKTDLRDAGRIQVEASEGRSFAQQNGLEFFETSAMQGSEVDAPFNFIADAFYKRYEASLQQVKEQL